MDRIEAEILAELAANFDQLRRVTEQRIEELGGRGSHKEIIVSLRNLQSIAERGALLALSKLPKH